MDGRMDDDRHGRPLLPGVSGVTSRHGSAVNNRAKSVVQPWQRWETIGLIVDYSS